MRVYDCTGKPMTSVVLRRRDEIARASVPAVVVPSKPAGPRSVPGDPSAEESRIERFLKRWGFGSSGRGAGEGSPSDPQDR